MRLIVLIEPQTQKFECLVWFDSNKQKNLFEKFSTWESKPIIQNVRVRNVKKDGGGVRFFDTYIIKILT